MSTNTFITPKNKRPRIAKGTLIATTNQARLACMKHYITYYFYKPISYKIVKKLVINFETPELCLEQ
jgi:hypothetical protein